MLSMTSINFSDWLRVEVENRGWSFRELGRRAGLSSGAVSQVITGANFPGPEFCNGVARALGVPPERVFREAGLLPAVIIGTDNDEKKKELDEYWRYLTGEERDTLATIAKAFYERRSSYDTE